MHPAKQAADNLRLWPALTRGRLVRQQAEVFDDFCA